MCNVGEIFDENLPTADIINNNWHINKFRVVHDVQKFKNAEAVPEFKKMYSLWLETFEFILTFFQSIARNTVDRKKFKVIIRNRRFYAILKKNLKKEMKSMSRCRTCCCHDFNSTIFSLTKGFSLRKRNSFPFP